LLQNSENFLPLATLKCLIGIKSKPGHTRAAIAGDITVALITQGFECLKCTSLYTLSGSIDIFALERGECREFTEAVPDVVETVRAVCNSQDDLLGR
jgi:hypothetical protein